MKMTRVRMLNTETGRYPGFGPTGQYHVLVGHEYEVPEDLGEAWVRQGQAEAVVPEPAPVKTTKKAKAATEEENDGQ
jgi:hypothetical protein